MIKDPADGIRQNLHKVQLVQRYLKSGRLLDIGCGLGYFLAAARLQGFSVYGLEGSAWARQYVEKEFGITVWPPPLETADVDAHTLDVCTMWHVIEHLPDPLAVLRKIRTLLRESGLLVMETRNYRGFDARKLGAEWGGWSLPYHLWHFDPMSFRLLVVEAGFRVVRLKVHYSNLVKKILNKIPVLGWLRNPIAALFAGSNLTIVAKVGK